MKQKIEVSPIAGVLLTALPLTQIAEYLVSADFKHILPEPEKARITARLNSLEYLTEHYVESEKKYTNPMLQLVSTHRPLIEMILSELFPEAQARPLAGIGENYILLTRFIKNVNNRTNQVQEEACNSTNVTSE